MKDLTEYFPGKECNCGAYYKGECACNTDWTPKQIYELKNLLEEVIIHIKTCPYPEFSPQLLEKLRKAGINI